MTNTQQNNLVPDLGYLAEQVNAALGLLNSNQLTYEQVGALASCCAAFAQTYQGEAAAVCPLTGEPTDSVVSLEGVAMGRHVAQSLLNNEPTYQGALTQAQQQGPSYQHEPVGDVGVLAPGPAEPPPSPEPPPNPTPTLHQFAQKQAASQAPQTPAAPAATPQAPQPPQAPAAPPQATPAGGGAVQGAAAQMVASVEANMGDRVIQTDEGPVFYDRMTQLAQEQTGWTEPQAQAFLANLATLRGHYQEWCQDTAWVNRQMAAFGVPDTQQLEAHVIYAQMNQTLGQATQDPSLYLPPEMGPELGKAVASFLEAMRSMERRQQELQGQAPT